MLSPGIERLAKNLDDVKRRIRAACERVDRDPAEVRLVAVTKSATVEAIRDLISLGQTDLAENRPQQLAQRAAILPESVRWHFIGHLQRNKIELVLPIAECIHSVDSLRLLRSVSQTTARTGRRPRLLLEVNVSGETSKGGFSPSELLAAWDEARALSGPQLVGLMTMAPLSDDPDVVRPVFRKLRELRDQMLHGMVRLEDSANSALFHLPELSMGMSSDFEIAIEEGATMVRVGSRLFEEG